VVSGSTLRMRKTQQLNDTIQFIQGHQCHDEGSGKDEPGGVLSKVLVRWIITMGEGCDTADHHDSADEQLEREQQPVVVICDTGAESGKAKPLSSDLFIRHAIE